VQAGRPGGPQGANGLTDAGEVHKGGEGCLIGVEQPVPCGGVHGQVAAVRSGGTHPECSVYGMEDSTGET